MRISDWSSDVCSSDLGYMVYWLAGNWHTPESGAWKCLVDHDGVFDTRIMGYATEELWFTEWENGGTPYDNPGGYEKFNPINHENGRASRRDRMCQYV